MKSFSFLICVLLSLLCNNVDRNINDQSGENVRHPYSDQNYSQVKDKIENDRVHLRNRYRKANEAERQQIFLASKEYLLQAIGNDLYAFWKGTVWDFNGTTSTPHEGAIACGYFVTALLHDAGYKLSRTKLAVCPSLTMMKELTSSRSVQNLSALNYQNFQERMIAYGKGLYIIGLDFHTGYIVNDGEDCWFLHSNYINKTGVTKERLSESAALKASKTRYVTCLTGNEKFLLHWLLN